jgi:hypothetical protein
MLVGQEQDLCPHHFRVRRGATTGETFELPVFGSCEGHLVSRFGSATLPDVASHRAEDNAAESEKLKTRNEFMIRCTKSTTPTAAATGNDDDDPAAL